jgi:hypothetical protein
VLQYLDCKNLQTKPGPNSPAAHCLLQSPRKETDETRTRAEATAVEQRERGTNRLLTSSFLPREAKDHSAFKPHHSPQNDCTGSCKLILYQLLPDQQWKKELQRSPLCMRYPSGLRYFWRMRTSFSEWMRLRREVTAAAHFSP